jgi:hypothetical protein
MDLFARVSSSLVVGGGGRRQTTDDTVRRAGERRGGGRGVSAQGSRRGRLAWARMRDRRLVPRPGRDTV